MSTYKLFTIVMLFILLIITSIILVHINDMKPPIKYMRDYQLELSTDSIYIMDDLRHVATIPYTDDSGLGKVIEDDNE